ncbi:MAG: cytochrome P450 [Polyangiales bacterium]
MPDGLAPDLDHLPGLDALPGPRAWPLVGALPSLLHPDGMTAGFGAVGERFQRDGMFRLAFPGGRAEVFVLSAALATEACDEARWEKVLGGPLPRIRAFGGDGLFTAYNHEESWHRAHRILSPGFAAGAMERYFPAMREVAGDLLAHWRRARGPVDVVGDMTRLTLDTISLCGFDHRFRSFERPALDPFLLALGRALQETVDGLRRPPFAPYEAWKARRFDADVAAMFAVVDRVIAERKRVPADRWPRDFLSLMLAEADPKTGARLPDDNIRYQILTFLIAGHETTAGLLAFTLHRVASDPALAARLRAESARVFGAGEPTLDHVRALDLHDRTLREALRLWPTVPAVARAAKADLALGKHRVRAGEAVILLLPSIHRDPAAWPDPERFDPDRFLPEASRGRPAGAYKPFGIGRRSCTGRHFALVEAALCLALVLRAFDFDAPAPLRLAPTATLKPRDLRLAVRPR